MEGYALRQHDGDYLGRTGFLGFWPTPLNWTIQGFGCALLYVVPKYSFQDLLVEEL
jgi:hypothetical protein